MTEKMIINELYDSLKEELYKRMNESTAESIVNDCDGAIEKFCEDMTEVILEDITSVIDNYPYVPCITDTRMVIKEKLDLLIKKQS